MRKLAIGLTAVAVLVLAGAVAWKADATPWRTGTADLPTATKNYSPVQKAACGGWGRWCPPGYVWQCRPRCRCRPC